MIEFTQTDAIDKIKKKVKKMWISPLERESPVTFKRFEQFNPQRILPDAWKLITKNLDFITIYKYRVRRENFKSVLGQGVKGLVSIISDYM